MQDINIFVSSTFSDMHRERDLLHQIAGLINRDIAPMGYRVALKDLRYGIDTANLENEREVEKKVLSNCFKTINQCNLFILLLGNRYGSVFEDLTIPSLYMPHSDLKGKSVTHLELEYGIQKINKEHILIFQRNFEGELKNAPPQYHENEFGAERVDVLKNALYEEKYTISNYSACIKQNAFEIDEYIFLKHGQGFIEDMVLRYIKHQAENTLPNIDEDSLSDDMLYYEITEKANLFSPQNRDFAKELITFRIRDLLHKDDYAKISELGSDGTAIKEYCKGLIEKMPCDFAALVEDICKIVKEVSNCEDNLFTALQIIAMASSSGLFGEYGFSLNEILYIACGNGNPPTQNYDNWLEWKQETSGIYHQQTPLQHALASFIGGGVLLDCTCHGYSFKNSDIARELSAVTDSATQMRVYEYAAKIFCFLPNQSEAFFNLLSKSKYDLCVSCLKEIRFDHRFTNAFEEYLKNNSTPEEITSLFKGLLDYMVRNSAEEKYIQYILQVENEYINKFDEDLSDELFYDLLIPLTESVYTDYYNANYENLTLCKICFLHNLYEDFCFESENLQPLLSLDQTTIAENFLKAENELFYAKSFDNIDEILDFANAITTISDNAEQWDEVIQALQVVTLKNDCYHKQLFENCITVALSEDEMLRQLWQRVMFAALEIHPDNDILDAIIQEVSEKIIEPSYIKGDYSLCNFALEFIYSLISAENTISHLDFLGWIALISSEVIDGLYKCECTAVVKEIAELQDEFLMMDYEELKKLEKQQLKKQDIWS